MQITRAKATALLNKGEMTLYDESRHNPIRGFTAAQLETRIKRARAARDRSRDLAKRQKLSSRASTGSKRGTSGSANQRSLDKAAILADILDRFDRMTRPRSFDPARDEFEVVIGLSHAGLAVLMTPLVRRLRQIAPRARLRFIQSRASAYEALEAGSCDLLIRPMPYENLPFRHRFLMRDRFVCLVDRDGPHARNGLTLESYAAARHILISFEGLYRPPWFDRMNEMGMPQQIALDLSSTSEIEEFLIGTDLVATVTEELAHLCSDRVALIPAPIHAHQDIYMFWSERTQERENMQWFRNLVAEMASQISSRRRATPDRDRGERDGGC